MTAKEQISTPDSRFESRFIVKSDPQKDNFVFNLPSHWWSRFYEYAWAAGFVGENESVLDAACGVCHPLKFYLASTPNEVYACDLDEKILSEESIKNEIIEEFHITSEDIPDYFFSAVNYAKASITGLPYANEKFDKIFCISVLEHLESGDIDRSLKEFKRVLKDDGLVILTFDFPRINLSELNTLLTQNNLEFVGGVEFGLPEDAIYFEEKSLYCFRAVIKKKQPKQSISPAFDYQNYWETRYKNMGNSGLGSYGDLAEYKVRVINKFLSAHKVDNVIEFGCGDGNNLIGISYNKYLGFDISKSAIDRCNFMFWDDPQKSFMLYDPRYFENKDFIKADLVVCLDVLYHIIPEIDFEKTLSDIFSCAGKYVILYTSIDAHLTEAYVEGSHVYHRDILKYLEQYTDFEIEGIVEQEHKHISSASFIMLRRRGIDAQSFTSKYSESSRKNIGFVTIWFERGQSYVTKTIRDALAKHHNTFIFARTGLVHGAEKLQDDGIWNVPNLTKYNSYDIPAFVLEKWIYDNNLDIVVFNEEYDWQLVEACKKTGVQIVTYLDYLKEDWIPKLNLYDEVLCSTQMSYNLVKEHCNASYIGWGVDTQLFNAAGNKEYTFFHNAGWLGTNFRKMTPAAVIAFDAVSKLRNNVSLLIHSQIGLEKLPPQIQDLIISNDKINFVVNTIPAPGLYHKCSILLFPTKLEGLGLPLFEALSSGMPVLATDAPPMNEFIKDGYNGYLIQVDHVEKRSDNIIFPESIISLNSLVEKMLHLIDQPKLLDQMSSNARNFAVEKLSLNGLSERINNLKIFNNGRTI